MTDQILDSLRYGGQGYSLQQAEPGLFSPWDYGIEPEDNCSDNWRGYIAHFDICEQRLYLDYLAVNHTPRRGPPPTEDPDDPLSMLVAGSAPLPSLNGVEASNRGFGYWHYEDIHLALDYTGTLTLSRSENAAELHYLELHFERGQLIHTTFTPKPDDLY